MRKIETELLDAIKSRRNWSKYNTVITFNDNSCYVYLHGNNIAVLDYKDNALVEMKLYSQTYLTATTKSRLNTVLTLCTTRLNNTVTNYCIYQKQFVWYLSCTNYNTDTQEFTTIFNKEFEEGMSINKELELLELMH